MKKLIFGIAALFMMSVVLVGCDNKKSKKDKDDEDEDERTEQVADDEDEDIDEEEKTATFNLAPEDKFVGILEDAVRIMKNSHIRTQDDVKRIADKMAPMKERLEKAMEELTSAYSQSELEEIGKRLEDKVNKLAKEGEKEGDRLQKEAEEAGIDVSELESLDIL